MKVKDVMNKITSVDSRLTISEIAKLMEKVNTGSVVVEEKGKHLGLITERDLIRKIISAEKNPSLVRAKEIMNAPLLTINANEDVENASRMMSEKNIRRLLVEENGKIIGKITQRGISNNIRYLFARRLTERFKTEDYDRPEFK